MSAGDPTATPVEIIAPPPEVENRDFGYFATPPARRLQPAMARGGHVFRWILTAASPDVFVFWPAALPQAGRYQVAVYVPGVHATTTQAHYYVHGIAGREEPSEHLIDQARFFNSWVPLGTFDFDPEQAPDIYVDAQNFSPEAPAREMAFAAVRWLLVPPGAVAWVWPVLDEEQIIGHAFNEPRPAFGANHLHEGVDLRARPGKPIVSVVPGTVVKVHHWNAPSRRGADAYGHHVVVEHADGSGSRVLYAHLDDFAPDLAEGRKVEQGQLLGHAGSTGNSTASHLHLTLSNPVTGLDGYVYPHVLDPTPFLLADPGRVLPHDPGRRVTAQAAVDMLYKLAPGLSTDGATLLDRLGWQDLYRPAQNRNHAFNPARLRTRPAGVTPEEWNYLEGALRELLGSAGGQAYARMPEGFHALPGVHGPAEATDAAWAQNDGRALKTVGRARLAAVKVLVPEIAPDTVRALAALPEVRLVLARLVARLDGPARQSAAERAEVFLLQVDPPGAGRRGPLGSAFHAGVRYYEVHHEPNRRDEGMFVNWENGREFAEFFTAVTAQLRARYPGARFGFPGLATGLAIAGRRYPADAFRAEASAAVRDADFLCVHLHWGRDGREVADAVRELDEFCRTYPDKIVFVSEFSNSAELRHASKVAKGDEYRTFYQALQDLPPNLGAAFAYCLSAGGDYQDETWIERDGSETAIVDRLGSI